VNGWRGAVNDPNIAIESVLDIDMVTATNPLLKQIIVYEDGDDPFNLALLLSLSAIASDHSADTISISYGLDEKQATPAQIAAEGAVFLQLAAQGQTVYVSSGDQGAYGRIGVGQNAPDPGSQPYVTSVGGTALVGFGAEEVWNLLGAGQGATGGGVSDFWTIPSWQVGYTLDNGGSATHRNVPDVAAVASPATGVSVYAGIYGGWLSIGGTSASAPIWAGFSSLMNAANKAFGAGAIGFINPTLYPFASSSYQTLNDVTSGTNGNPAFFAGVPGYFAGYGYDNTTGWGSMNVSIR